jgi:hypothetical protein
MPSPEFKPYAHPTLEAAYSREADDETVEHVFDTGNGHLVRVSQHQAYDKFVCDVLLVPQFPGASIYNSVSTNTASMHTTNRYDVTVFINTVIEDYMLEVNQLEKLKEEFND